MTKNNEYIIAKQKPSETVYEITDKYQTPSFEEFMKSYEGGTNYADLNTDDISISRSYGPGNSQSGTTSEDRAKAAGVGVATAVGVGVLSFVCPPAGAAAAAAYGTISAGAAATTHLTNNDDVRDAAELYSITFGLAAAGNPVGSHANKLAGGGGKCIVHIPH
jgi:hypothetical protein